MAEDETDFGLDDIIPAAVSRAAKNGRKKKNEIEMEKLKKRTSVKSVRYAGLDINQVSISSYSLDRQLLGNLVLLRLNIKPSFWPNLNIRKNSISRNIFS
jgi:hypothetical protein